MTEEQKDRKKHVAKTGKSWAF